MNKIHRIVWNESTGTWTAVSEIAKAHGKPASSGLGRLISKLPTLRPVLQALSLAGLVMLPYGVLHAQMAPSPTQLPTGGQVVAGQAAISQSGAVMNINQSSNRAAIDWQTYNLGSAATLNYHQPSVSSVTLNRVNDANPSQIFGRINANGQVFLSNPNGIYFAPGASVNVGALVATTHRISLDDFMAGKARFERHGTTGEVVNEGELQAALGGYIALLAPEVRNEGVIVADLGTVAMAAGEAFDLQFDSNNTLASLRIEPATIKTLVENKSAVLAPGGLIILSARAADTLQGSVVNSGDISASILVSKGGRILLEGDDITLQSGSSLVATGATGGGEVLVGGDWQGSGDMHQATTVTMEAGASIDASATQNGDGGKVVLWSDIRNPGSLTSVHGNISARGGANGGNGGQIETSGAHLDIEGALSSAAAPHGQGGEWLLDPYDWTIDTQNAAIITTALNDGTNVTITTTYTTLPNPSTGSSSVDILQNQDTTNSPAGTQYGDIRVNASINKTSGNDATLKLMADRDIIIGSGASISSTSSKLNIVLWSNADNSTIYWNGANNTSDTAGAIQINSGASLLSNGGDITLGGGAGTTLPTGVAQATGILTITGIELNNVTVNSAGGDISLRGAGVHAVNASTGMYLHNGTSITSGSGSIHMYGESQAFEGSTTGFRNGIRIDNASLMSTSTATDAVVMNGIDGYANRGGTGNDREALSLTNATITASGGVTFAGDVQVYSGSILTTSGTSDTLSITPYESDAFASDFVWSGTGSNFVGTDSINGLTINDIANLSGLTIGKSTSTTNANITSSSAINISGPISLYGGNITLNNSLTSTASGAAILISASGYISTANSAKTIATNNGNISLIADADANGVGQLDLDYTTLSTGSGNVLVRGETFSWNVGVGMSPTISSTTGTFTFESSDASFGQGVDTAWFNLPSTLSGLTVGKTTNTQNVVSTNALSVDGPIALYGSSITLNAGLSSTASGADILLKGSGQINIAADSDIQTNNGDIVLWSNAADSTSGGIYVLDNVSFNSANGATNQTTGGGNIVLAGGSVVDVNGLPTGAAVGTGTNANGITLATETAGTGTISFYSGGGDVFMKGATAGASGTSLGINWSRTGIVNAGAGSITIEGSSTRGHGITLGSYGDIDLTAANGISITGTSTATGGNYYGLALASGAGNGLEVNGAGAISISGTAAGTTYGLVVSTDVLAESGDISLSGGEKGVQLATYRGITIGQKAGTSVTASSSDLTITGDVFQVANASSMEASGSVLIQPAAADFSSSISTGSLTIGAAQAPSQLTIGKSASSADGANDAAVTLGAATITGPISVYGGTINVNGNLDTTAGAAVGDLLLKASGDISLAANTSITTTGGDVILWANSDGQTTSGSVLLRDGSSIETAGGHVWLGGGSGTATWNGLAVGDGYAVSGQTITPPVGTTVKAGVYFENTSIDSGGGDIAIYGRSSTSGEFGLAALGTFDVDADAGKIIVEGIAVGAGRAGNLGLHASVVPGGASATHTSM